MFSLFHSTACVVTLLFQAFIHILFKGNEHIYNCLSCASAKLLFSESMVIGLLASGRDTWSWMFMFLFSSWDLDAWGHDVWSVYNGDMCSCLCCIGLFWYWCCIDTYRRQNALIYKTSLWTRYCFLNKHHCKLTIAIHFYVMYQSATHKRTHTHFVSHCSCIDLCTWTAHFCLQSVLIRCIGSIHCPLTLQRSI